MVKKRSFLIAVLLLICAAAVFSAFFRPQTAEAASVDDNYHFTSADVKITVNKDKTYDICETLTVYFEKGGINTGIIRDIQRITKVTRFIDGTARTGKNYFTNVTDVGVTMDGGECKVTRELYDGGQFYSIKMQNPVGYMSANSTHVFELKYKYHDGGGKLDGFDDFTFDVFGYEMAKTDKFTAEVTFASGTDLTNVQVRRGAGDWQPDRSAGESWSVERNSIRITAFPGERTGYTVQVLLPDGYFDCHKVVFWYYFPFAAVAVIAVVAMAVIVVKGRRKPVETVAYYPPEGMTLARFSCVWNAEADYRDASVYVLKWARQGIVEILPDGKGHVVVKAIVGRGRKKTPSERLAEGGKQYFESAAERDYFNKLFSGIGGLNYTCSTRELSVTLPMNKKSLYESSVKLMKNGDRPKVAQEKREKLFKALIPFISLIPMICVLGYMAVLFDRYMLFLFVPFMIAGTFTAVMFRITLFPLILIFPLSFTCMTYGFGVFMGPDYIDADMALLLYDYACMFAVAPVVWAVGCFVLPFIIRLRTDSANAEYGQILGFKRFLLTAELPRIEMLFDENPEYFSDILPYCFVMGISDKVLKRFAALEKFAVPDYVPAYDDMDRFRRCVRSACRSGSPSRMSSGGGSGGGHSGGGGGSGGSSGGGSGGGGSRGC